MALMGKLLNGVLTDIQDVPVARTWGDGGTDVALASQPTMDPPYGYDSGTKLATANPTAKTTQRQNAASALIDALSDVGQLFRATAAVLKNEINLLRDRLTAQDNAVAAATSLADLKSRWAALAASAPMADRTLTQARNAIKTEATNGDTDT